MSCFVYVLFRDTGRNVLLFRKNIVRSRPPSQVGPVFNFPGQWVFPGGNPKTGCPDLKTKVEGSLKELGEECGFDRIILQDFVDRSVIKKAAFYEFSGSGFACLVITVSDLKGIKEKFDELKDSVQDDELCDCSIFSVEDAFAEMNKGSGKLSDCKGWLDAHTIFTEREKEGQGTEKQSFLEKMEIKKRVFLKANKDNTLGSRRGWFALVLKKVFDFPDRITTEPGLNNAKAQKFNQTWLRYLGDVSLPQIKKTTRAIRARKEREGEQKSLEAASAGGGSSELTPVVEEGASPAASSRRMVAVGGPSSPMEVKSSGSPLSQPQAKRARVTKEPSGAGCQEDASSVIQQGALVDLRGGRLLSPVSPMEADEESSADRQTAAVAKSAASRPRMSLNARLRSSQQQGKAIPIEPGALFGSSSSSVAERNPVQSGLLYQGGSISPQGVPSLPDITFSPDQDALASGVSHGGSFAGRRQRFGSRSLQRRSSSPQGGPSSPDVPCSPAQDALASGASHGGSFAGRSQRSGSRSLQRRSFSPQGGPSSPDVPCSPAQDALASRASHGVYFSEMRQLSASRGSSQRRSSSPSQERGLVLSPGATRWGDSWYSQYDIISSRQSSTATGMKLPLGLSPFEEEGEQIQGPSILAAMHSPAEGFTATTTSSPKEAPGSPLRKATVAEW